jgi:phage terminase Nu1 subunit (DNA packaging protein)
MESRMAKKPVPGVSLDTEISTESAAELLGVTSARVRQLVASGHIARAGHGRISLRAAVAGYVRSLKESAGDRTMNAADNRVRDARAREIEMRIARELRELVPLDEAEMALDILTAVYLRELAGQPARLTRDMAFRKVVEADVHGIRERLGKTASDCRRLIVEGVEPM